MLAVVALAGAVQQARLALLAGVEPADDALELGKLRHHGGQQIAFRELGRALAAAAQQPKKKEFHLIIRMMSQRNLAAFQPPRGLRQEFVPLFGAIDARPGDPVHRQLKGLREQLAAAPRDPARAAVLATVPIAWWLGSLTAAHVLIAAFVVQMGIGVYWAWALVGRLQP